MGVVWYILVYEVCTPVFMHSEAAVLFSNVFHLISLRQGLTLSLKLTISTRLAGSEAWGIHSNGQVLHGCLGFELIFTQ